MSKSNRVLLLWVALFAIGGLVEPFAPHPGQMFNEIGVAENLLSAFLGFTWCKAHAQERAIVAPSGSALFVALLAPIGVPLYFFRSMHWKAAARATLKAIGFVVVLLAVMEGGYYLGDHFAA